MVPESQWHFTTTSDWSKFLTDFWCSCSCSGYRSWILLLSNKTMYFMVILVQFLVLKQRPFISPEWLQTCFLPSIFCYMKIFLIWFLLVQWKNQGRANYGEITIIYETTSPNLHFFLQVDIPEWPSASCTELWLHPSLRVNRLVLKFIECNCKGLLIYLPSWCRCSPFTLSDGRRIFVHLYCAVSFYTCVLTTI